MPISALKEQYEAYPYPLRNPADEAKRLITGTPSSIDDIEHYLYAGKLPKKLRILSAGGGTGDAIVQMGTEAQERGLEVELTHLDLSTHSQDIARQRATLRKLDIRFVNDSLLNAKQYGEFDYIDCCGVLHHLDVPEDGLKALVSALSPEGSMGLMVYAPLGRTGVYPLQAALRRVIPADWSPQEKVRLAKKLLAQLPDSNWLKRNPLIKDHEYNDAGLYDLLLHSQDRCYDVRQFADFLASGGLEIIEFMQPVKYDPTVWLTSPELVKRLPQDRIERAALAEEVSGNLHKHIAYATRKGRPGTVTPLTPESIPFYHYFEGVTFGQKLAPGGNLVGQLAGMSVNMSLPRRAGLIMQRINGRDNWRTIHANMQQAMGKDAPSWEGFWTETEELFHKLQGVNVLLLRMPQA